MPERRRPTITSLVRGRRSRRSPREHPPDGLTDDVRERHPVALAARRQCDLRRRRAGRLSDVARRDVRSASASTRTAWRGSACTARKSTRSPRWPTAFQLHELAVEDAIVAHQRPKLERYGDTLFVVLRPARYLDETEEVEFGEVHVFVGTNFVLTVRHSEAPDLGAVRHRLESDRDLLRRGPEAVLYAIVDRVVDGYYPVVAGLANDIDEIEIEVFGGRSPSLTPDLRAVSRGHGVPEGHSSADDGALRR